MSKILCITNGLPGLLFSSLELAKRLEAAGQEVIYSSYPEAREVVERHGLEFVPIAPDRHAEFLAEDARSGFANRLVNLERRRERACGMQGARDFDRVIARIAPDLALVDAEMHEYVLEALGAQAPVALLNTFVSIWRRPGLPPPHRMARPGVGWKGRRPGTDVLWAQLRLSKWWRAALLRWRQVGCDRVSLLHRQANDLGLDLDRLVDASQWSIPFTFKDLPVLSLHALEFDFPHRPLDTVHSVGPMVPESRIDGREGGDEGSRLAAILERYRSSDSQRRLIYAGFGSFFTAGSGLVRRLIDAVARRPDWEMVVSLGGRPARDDLGPLPSNVSVLSWVPQLALLREADVAVTHGGCNTVDECVINGVPMLIYCGWETDMAGVTSRVVYHGIGLAGDERRDDARAMEAQLDRLLTDPHFGESIESLRVRYLSYARDRVAERVVESLIEGRGTGAGERSRRRSPSPTWRVSDE